LEFGRVLFRSRVFFFFFLSVIILLSHI